MNRSIEINIDKLVFDCRVSGNEKDELVILLHGFPESAYMWIELMKDISVLGFYCIAPNMRGYSRGARPSGKKNYTLEKLVADVMGIAKPTGRDKFHLIGHDWGAAIGWKTVYDHPDVILSWTGLSIPHLQAFGEAIVNDTQQQRMSRYMKAFQWPLLPEIRIRRNDFEIFRKLWKYSSKEEIEDYLSIFRDKKALSAALNYYRSNFRFIKKASKTQVLGNIEVPTLFIWGEKDMAIGPYSVEKSHEYIKNYYKFLKLDSGHWLIQSKYLEVKKEIQEHLLKFKSLANKN